MFGSLVSRCLGSSGFYRLIGALGSTAKLSPCLQLDVKSISTFDDFAPVRFPVFLVKYCSITAENQPDASGEWLDGWLSEWVNLVPG